jgi:hypothetical protein
LCLGYGLVRRPSRPESVAVLGERRIPLFLKNLQHGLLNQAVDDTGNAEPSDPPIRFRNFHPLNRPWLIVSVEQLEPNCWPVLTQECLGDVDGHPIDTRTSLVSLNAFPRSLKVLAATHLLHQMFWESRAFGRRHRHRRFGSCGRGSRGFTPTLRA